MESLLSSWRRETLVQRCLGTNVCVSETSAWLRCTVQVAPHSFAVQVAPRSCAVWGSNHPLVTSGEGFWTTNTMIVTGYVLKRNTRVFRPIFKSKRNRCLQGVHNTIKEHIGGGGRFVVRMRQNLARSAMLGLQLPVAVICYIGGFV